MAGGLVAGGIQNRFQTASEALNVKWERLNPMEGFKRVFSGRSLMPTGVHHEAQRGGFDLFPGADVAGRSALLRPVSVSRFGTFIARRQRSITGVS